MAIFPIFFLGSLGQENVFYDILEQNKTFLFYIKQEVQKDKKITFFLKGLTHGFGPKKGIFPAFFYLGNKRQKNIFYDILERKSIFLEYKNQKFKKTKK